MLVKLGAAAWARTQHSSPWTNVYGLARTLLALGTFVTFVTNAPSTLFHPTTFTPEPPVCEGVGELSLFCLAQPSYLFLLQGAAAALLLLVASGWRPRYTGMLHWWITFSFVNSSTLIDGGDQIAAILTLLLLPITLTDGRRWHWSALPRPVTTALHPRTTTAVYAVVAVSAFWVLRLQVAGIYFHSGIAKLAVEEWRDGTALYYWLTDGLFGVSIWLEPLTRLVLFSPLLVTALTWSVLALEILLGAALFMEKKWWQSLLISGVLLHTGIAFLHGLVSFWFTMTAALILYLRPYDQVFDMAGVMTWPTRLARRACGIGRTEAPNSQPAVTSAAP